MSKIIKHMAWAPTLVCDNCGVEYAATEDDLYAATDLYTYDYGPLVGKYIVLAYVRCPACGFELPDNAVRQCHNNYCARRPDERIPGHITGLPVAMIDRALERTRKRDELIKELRSLARDLRLAALRRLVVDLRRRPSDNAGISPRLPA